MAASAAKVMGLRAKRRWKLGTTQGRKIQAPSGLDAGSKFAEVASPSGPFEFGLWIFDTLFVAGNEGKPGEEEIPNLTVFPLRHKHRVLG